MTHLKPWLPAILLMTIIFVLSSQPNIPGPPDPTLKRIIMKGGHALGYGMLAASYAHGLASTRRSHIVPLAFILTLLYAISDEWHQTFVPNRSGSPIDVLIDITGATGALWLWWRRQQLQR